MQDLAQCYNEIFKPSSKAMEQTYLEGVENCVTKNLYSVLFGDCGTGSNPSTAQAQQDPNIPTEFSVPAAHQEET